MMTLEEKQKSWLWWTSLSINEQNAVCAKHNWGKQLAIWGIGWVDLWKQEGKPEPIPNPYPIPRD